MNSQRVLCREGFGDFPPGPFPCDYTPLGEYHMPPMTGYRGRWREGTIYHQWRGRPNWQVLPFSTGPVMAMTRRRREAHALLLTGDELWADYQVCAQLRPLSVECGAGICGRVLHNRRYVAVWLVDGKEVRLTERDHDEERTLASAPWAHSADAFHRVALAFVGTTVTARIEGGPTLTAATAIPRGKVGLVAADPAAYRELTVTASAEAAAVYIDARREAEAIEAREAAALPRPVLWGTIDTPGYGAGRALRWGDLDGDGRLEFVVTQNTTVAGGDGTFITCMTAVDLDGRVLWQWGRANPGLGLLTYDVPVQIHDLDGDGRPEVVAITHLELTVRDGLTGRVQASVPMPPPGPKNNWCDERLFARSPGDCIAFCDLRGRGRAGDLLVKDRYNNVWAYDGALRPLWHFSGDTGHFPCPYDIDGDGRDEVMIGDSLVGPDGTVRWRRPLKDHADNAALGPYGVGGALIAIAASGDAGLHFYDLEGRVLAADNTGHTQGVTIAKLRPDVPGLQYATVTFWREAGLITIYDERCRRLGQYQPNYLASHLQPVNWAGDGTELLLLNADPDEGGCIDGCGRRVLRLPRDGHPVLCAEAVDVTGDARDEIVVWDQERLWMYTQEGAAAAGAVARVYAPRRLPHYNSSNYRAQVSLPRWAETS